MSVTVPPISSTAELPISAHKDELVGAIRDAERELAHQAEVSYKRMVQDQRAGAPAKKVGASATPERA